MSRHHRKPDRLIWALATLAAVGAFIVLGRVADRLNGSATVDSSASQMVAESRNGTAAKFVSPSTKGAVRPASDVDANDLSGTASVIDGDTIEIHGQRIRLFGVDAPEGRQSCVRNGQPWRCGSDAANALDRQIGGFSVSCDGRDTDKYGRIVAVCTSRGVDLNGWLVEQGWAVAYRYYSKDYVPAEGRAKTAARGIWGSEFEMPWDWRRAKRG